jgi:hypothetical protein
MPSAMVEHGTYAQVAELLWTGGGGACACLARRCPTTSRPFGCCRGMPPMDALRTGISPGRRQHMAWPPTVDQRAP